MSIFKFPHVLYFRFEFCKFLETREAFKSDDNVVVKCQENRIICFLLVFCPSSSIVDNERNVGMLVHMLNVMWPIHCRLIYQHNTKQTFGIHVLGNTRPPYNTCSDDNSEGTTPL